jgi:hypothetical protein
VLVIRIADDERNPAAVGVRRRDRQDNNEQ